MCGLIFKIFNCHDRRQTVLTDVTLVLEDLVKGKVKCTLVQAVRPTALEWGEGSSLCPGRSLPPGKTRYPLYRRLSGPQGRSENLAPHRDSIPGESSP